MKKTIAIILAVIVVILAVVFWVLPHFGGNSPAPTPPGSGTNTNPSAPVGGLHEVASPQTAYDVAAARAKQWKPDAGLAKLSLGDTSGGAWTFLFTSAANR